MDEITRKMLAEAKIALENSYSPYSKFRVGCSVLTNDGKIFNGCNIENASYGLTICAERVAIFKANSEGYRHFSKILLITDSDKVEYPCGACRQVINEFCEDIDLLLFSKDEKLKKIKFRSIFPHGFNLNN